MTRHHLAVTTGLAATIVASAIALTACSSDSGSSAQDSASAAASTAASAPASAVAASPAASGMVGTSPGTWSPLHATLADDGATVDMVPEQVLLIDIDSKPGVDLFISSSDESIAKVEQPEGDEDSGVTAVPAVIAVAPGDATITVQEVDDNQDQTPPTVLTLTVHVTPRS